MLKILGMLKVPGNVPYSISAVSVILKTVPGLERLLSYMRDIIFVYSFQSKPGEVEQAVKDAIDAGYRHIDGAFVYGNEKEVGAGIRAKIAEGVVKREEIFLTTKVGTCPAQVDFLCNDPLLTNVFLHSCGILSTGQI